MRWQPVARGAAADEEPRRWSPAAGGAPAERAGSRGRASLEDWGGDPLRDAWATAPLGTACARPSEEAQRQREAGEAAAQGTSATEAARREAIEAATEDTSATEAGQRRNEPAEAIPATEEERSRFGAAEAAPETVEERQRRWRRRDPFGWALYGWHAPGAEDRLQQGETETAAGATSTAATAPSAEEEQRQRGTTETTAGDACATEAELPRGEPAEGCEAAEAASLSSEGSSFPEAYYYEDSCPEDELAERIANAREAEDAREEAEEAERLRRRAAAEAQEAWDEAAAPALPPPNAPQDGACLAAWAASRRRGGGGQASAGRRCTLAAPATEEEQLRRGALSAWWLAPRGQPPAERRSPLAGPSGLRALKAAFARELAASGNADTQEWLRLHCWYCRRDTLNGPCQRCGPLDPVAPRTSTAAATRWRPSLRAEGSG